MLKKWKKVSEKILYRNKWWTYKVDIYEFPEGNQGEYHYAFTHGSVFIIPIAEDGKIIMVKQYRYLNDRLSVEFPGGGVKIPGNEEFEAHKELIEETGYDGELEKIGIFNPYNGVTNEICHVYVARNLHRSEEFIKDDSEEFEILYLSKDEISNMIETNEIYDGMTLAAWSLSQKILNS
ncbi:MAG: NUDIX hydrolase [Ignavibacteria bacterium]|nr:NUDIX hydrolase [Ignavibacteria bacterium]